MDGFDLGGVPPDWLRHLVWVRCENPDQAFAAADILVRDGIHAVVVVDLRGLAEQRLRRLPATVWFRLQRAAEGGSAAVLVQTEFPLVPAAPWRLSLGKCLPLRPRLCRIEPMSWMGLEPSLDRFPDERGGCGSLGGGRLIGWINYLGAMDTGCLLYAVIRAENFALQALRRNDPALAGRPMAVVYREGRKAAVAEVSAEATGVTPGLPVDLAVARCPGLRLCARDPAMEVEAQRLLLAAGFTLAPRVEATAAGCCTVDLQGADPDRLPGSLRRRAAELAALGLPVRIGVGGTAWLAMLAGGFRYRPGFLLWAGPLGPAAGGEPAGPRRSRRHRPSKATLGTAEEDPKGYGS